MVTNKSAIENKIHESFSSISSMNFSQTAYITHSSIWY